METSNLATESLEQLYNIYRAPLAGFLRRIVGDAETAEDLCHETFMKAMRALAVSPPPQNARAWLYRIATNVAYDHLRRGRVRKMVWLADETIAELPAPVADQLDEREAVEQALAALPQHYALPLVLHSCAGHRVEEIAAAFGCPVNTMKVRLFRARELFRRVYTG